MNKKNQHVEKKTEKGQDLEAANISVSLSVKDDDSLDFPGNIIDIQEPNSDKQELLNSTLLIFWSKLAIPAVVSNVSGFLCLLINSAFAG